MVVVAVATDLRASVRGCGCPILANPTGVNVTEGSATVILHTVTVVTVFPRLPSRAVVSGPHVPRTHTLKRAYTGSKYVLVGGNAREQAFDLAGGRAPVSAHHVAVVTFLQMGCWRVDIFIATVSTQSASVDIGHNRWIQAGVIDASVALVAVHSETG